MNIFEFNDYKVFVKKWIAFLPKNGRGELRRIAQELNVSTTMISQCFSGDKKLSLELASELCDYLNLSEKETEYFFLLVELDRAGSFHLRQKLQRQIKTVQKEMLKLQSRLKKDIELSAETEQTYYSQWLYTAIHNLVAIPSVNDSQVIAERLNVPRATIQKVLEFLIREKLVVQKSGKLDVGPQHTHVGADNHFAVRHHQNWRLQGFQRMQSSNEANLFFTGGYSLSEEVAEKIRQELPALIEKINKWVGPSPSEVARCLNIDWFEY